jgi:hypothetical protein
MKERFKVNFRLFKTIYVRLLVCYLNTHSEYLIVITFTHNNGCMNASHCYVIRTLSVLL